MKKFDVEKWLEELEGAVDRPLVTAKFGDKWKEWAMTNLDKEKLIDIAWRQGRKAQMLEEKLREVVSNAAQTVNWFRRIFKG